MANSETQTANCLDRDAPAKREFDRMAATRI
jgi:hypothetical protein